MPKIDYSDPFEGKMSGDNWASTKNMDWADITKRMDAYSQSTHEAVKSTNDLSKSTAESNAKIVKMTAAIHGVTQVLNMMGRAASAVSDTLGSFLKESVESSIDLNEQFNRLNQVFTEISSGRLNEFVEAVSDAFYLSRLEATKMVASIADMGQTLQLTQESSLKFSGMVIKLAGDLTSLQNRMQGTADTAESLQAGIFGMTRRLREMQIATLKTDKRFMDLRNAFMGGTDAANNMKVVTKLIDERIAAGDRLAVSYKKLAVQYFRTDKLGKKASEAMAQLAISYEQSIPAIDDFARTSKEAANSLRSIQSSFIDIKTTVGDYILDQLQLGKIITNTAKGLRALSQLFRAAGNEMKAMVVIGAALVVVLSTALVAIIALTAAVAAIVLVVITIGWTILLGTLAIITSLALLAVAAIGLFVAALYALGDGGTIIARISSGFEKMADYVIDIVAWVVTLGEIAYNVFSGFWMVLKPVLSTIWDIGWALSKLVFVFTGVALAIKILWAVLLWLKGGLLWWVGFLNNFWQNVETLLSKAILFFEATSGLIVDSLANIVLAFDALWDAMTGDVAGAKRKMESLVDVMGNFEKAMAEYYKLEINLDFKLKDLPKMKDLKDLLAGFGDLTGGGSDTTNKAPKAIVEGTSAASNLIAKLQSENDSPALRTATATEQTAAAANVLAQIMANIEDEGIKLGNAASSI